MKPSLKYAMIGIAIASVYASLTADSDQASQTVGEAKASETKTHTGPRHIRVQVEYIEMPLLTMSELLDNDKAAESDVILRARVAELIKAGKAKIIETQMLVARSGEKSTSESIQEFIYPTEYEPPEVPKTVYTSADGTKTEGYDKDLATGPTPTAFETRNLGSTLEVEPSICKDSRCIDLRLAPEIVAHTKNITYATWKDKHGTADIVMPDFYTMRVTTAITVINGKAALLGVLSPKNDQGHVDYNRKVMVFVKARIINTK